MHICLSVYLDVSESGAIMSAGVDLREVQLNNVTGNATHMIAESAP